MQESSGLNVLQKDSDSEPCRACQPQKILRAVVISELILLPLHNCNNHAY